MEIQTLRSELLSSKGESDQWYLDISKVKKELELAIDNENRLEEENRQLEKALDGLKQEKRQLLGELDNLNEGVTEEISKNNELERVIEELIENKRQDEALISELRNSIENKENALVEANRTIDLMELEEKKARKHMEKEGDEVLFLKNKLTSLEGNLRFFGGLG